MRSVNTLICALCLVGLGAGSAQAAPAPTPSPLEQRVQRLEKLLASQSLVEMLTRLDALQQEVQQLRGEVEQQTFQIDQLKQRQRELYLDIDRRLSRMEREGGASTAAPAASGLVSGTPDKAPQPAAQAAVPVQSASPAQVRKEREAYQRAFDLLKELRYEQAISAFRDFLKSYPSGRYAHIAQYWVGEANYARRHFKEAIEDYRKLISAYPNSPKVAEAMLKIGYSYNELGQPEETRKTLEELKQRYPDTTESGQADSLLKRLQKQ